MIASPPRKIILNPFAEITSSCPDKISDYLEWFSPIDSKGRYLHYDALRFRVPKHLDKDLVWAIVRLSRARQLTKLYDLGEPEKLCNFMLTPTIQKVISETDRHTTSASLEWMSTKIGEENHFRYLLNDLIEDEAISSSQLEGAATTIEVAKDMLKRKRKARTPDEKMIIGNYKMMHFAWENRNKELSVDLIRELHAIGTEGIDDETYTPGVFRKTNDVKVVDADGEVVHNPPAHEGLKSRLKSLSKWANVCHDDTDKRDYLHPLIKAIALHFAIGYEHPFRDGNGRVARSLFYWYMFKNDFAAFRYISISVLLKSAPVKYGKSYLFTESDNMDMTYFIDYQCSILLRAISDFKSAYQNTLKEIEGFNRWLWEAGLYRKLNDKQQTVFQVAKSGAAMYFTATNVKENLGCSYNTASATLNGLVELNLFKKKKSGREWVFSMLEKDKIKELWK